MQLIQPPQIEENTPCPYLDGRDKRYEYFLAGKLTAEEVSGYLATGWRKFGLYYFRPACPECSSCTPLRVLTEDFVPSRSQRRVLKKGSELTVKFGPLKLTDRIYAIYENHTVERMGQSCDVEEFLLNFYVASCPALQSEVYLGDELAIRSRGANPLPTRTTSARVSILTGRAKPGLPPSSRLGGCRT